MGNIIFVSGEWNEVPQALRELCWTPIQAKETERRMAEKGAFLLKCLGDNYVFTNNHSFFLGFRLAVMNDEEEAHKRVKFLHYHDGVCHKPVINQDGRIDKWPKGFFDLIDEALTEFIDVPWQRKKARDALKLSAGS